MGTRHLIAVYRNGEPVVAQYGQWYGYPRGQGLDLLTILRNIMEEDHGIENFKNSLDQCRFGTESEFTGSYVEKFPFTHRIHGAQIIKFINENNNSNEIVLKNDIDFAGDSLFCEWAYIIDLDREMFEIYEGCNKILVGEGERFPSSIFDDGGEYEPVKFVKEYTLHELPTDDEFIEALDTNEDDTE